VPKAVPWKKGPEKAIYRGLERNHNSVLEQFRPPAHKSDSEVIFFSYLLLTFHRFKNGHFRPKLNLLEKYLPKFDFGRLLESYCWALMPGL
jgi:hypothetical protein